MASKIVSIINNAREEVISVHYTAAFNELQDKVRKYPLRTEFVIYEGCVNAEMTNEIAHRLQAANITAVPGTITAVPATYGIFTTGYYLNVTIALPEYLVHKKEEEVVVEPNPKVDGEQGEQGSDEAEPPVDTE